MVHKLKILYEKCFLSPYFFTIAIRKKGEKSILDCPEFQPEYILPARRTRWSADPMLAEDGDKTYLFFESVIHGKGRIEAAPIREDCSVGESRVILEDESHYSYPFVFRMSGMWYMIPETSQQEEVRLYRAVAFPYVWEKKCVLLRKKAVDTTAFQWNGQWYLQTFLLCPGTERVIPQIYEVDFEAAQPVRRALAWKGYDSLRCRGAGPCMEKDGVMYRPAQENEENRYGNALRFCKMELTREEYRETEIAGLTADRIQTGIWHDGVHTYSTTGKYEAIDLRIRKFDPMKVFRTAIGRVRALVGGQRV